MLIVSLALVLISQASHADEVVATVDRNNLTVEETLNLKVRYQGNNQAATPELEDLMINFDIISQSRSNQFRSFNGQVESWVEWSFVIAPKKEGKLLIPSFNLDGNFSTPIEVTVTKAKPLNLGSGQTRDIFLETELDHESAYVQQQVLLTLRLNTSIPVSSITPEELKLPQAKIEMVSEQRYNRNINGRDYAVVELVYALYPQESGKLTIPSLTWEATIGSRSNSLFDLYSRSSMRRLRSDAETINILPKPDSFSGNSWLPAKNLSITETWSDGFPEFVQGEPITRNIIVTADGLTASQLPEMPVDYPDNINQYPEPTKADEQKSNHGIVTQATQAQALLVTQPGTYTLPEVSLTWWDTDKNEQAVVRLPARQITVKAAAGANTNAPPIITKPTIPPVIDLAAPATAGNQNSGSSNWPLLLISNLVTAVVVVILTLLWLKMTGKAATQPHWQEAAEEPPLKSVQKQLRKYCHQQQTQQVHATLLLLSRTLDPKLPATLANVSRQLTDSRAQAAIAQLDRSLFHGEVGTAIDFASIAKACSELGVKPSKKSSTQLAPLNPV